MSAVLEVRLAELQRQTANCHCDVLHPANPPEAYCDCGALCIVYPSDGTRGVCPEHCPDHDYEYERGDGWMCRYCGREPPPDWFDVD